MNADQKRNARPRSLDGRTPWSMRSSATPLFSLDMRLSPQFACIYHVRKSDKLSIEQSILAFWRPERLCKIHDDAYESRKLSFFSIFHARGLHRSLWRAKP